MSDRDASHLLVELQEARHLADSNRKAFLKANERCVELMELLRWRKWPEEKPEAGGKYLVIWFDDAKGLWLDDIKVVQCNEPLRECYLKLGYFYWRPIGPLPGGE